MSMNSNTWGKAPRPVTVTLLGDVVRTKADGEMVVVASAEATKLAGRVTTAKIIEVDGERALDRMSGYTHIASLHTTGEQPWTPTQIVDAIWAGIGGNAEPGLTPLVLAKMMNLDYCPDKEV